MRTIFFATIESDDFTISENAKIRAFSTRSEAEAWLREMCDPDEDAPASITIERGNFSDCWVKTTNEPEAGARLSPFTLADCNIQAPGTHPGVRAWWITPRADVLVAISAREIA